jgi:hypothetical protein
VFDENRRDVLASRSDDELFDATCDEELALLVEFT